MKSPVKYSSFCIVTTVCILVALLCGIYFLRTGPSASITLAILLLAVLIPALFYAPLAVCVKNGNVCVRSVLAVHKVAIDSITSVKPFQPTLGAIRLFASGGFFGYWGLFSERDIGRYRGYYGRSSDCFLLVTKSGAKYVLGCKNPSAIVNYISEKIKNC